MVHCFSISVIAILVSMQWTEVVQRHIPVKKQKHIKEKKTTKKQEFDPLRSVDFIKRNDM